MTIKISERKKSKFHLGTWHVNDPVRQWASWGYMSWCILDQCRDLDPCILNLSIFEDGRQTTVYLLTDVLPTTLNLSSEICTTNSKYPFQIDDFKWILTKLKNERLLCICCNLDTEANIVPCNSHVFGMEVIQHVSTVQDKNRDGSRFFSFKREREKEMITELTLTHSSLQLWNWPNSPTFISSCLSFPTGQWEIGMHPLYGTQTPLVFLPHTIWVSLSSAFPDFSSLTVPSLYLSGSGIKIHKTTWGHYKELQHTHSCFWMF